MKTLVYLKEKFARLPATKKAFVVGLFVLVLAVASWTGYLVGAEKFEFIDQAISPKGKLITGKPEEAKVQHPITGISYTKKEAESWQNRIPMTVMVENSTVARPQRGLSKADIVYEALAEGDITRFAVVFSTNSSQVGPVRSAREYYMDWALEYKAAYAHWGGNEFVRALASQTFGGKDLDQFAIGGAAFYRIPANSRSEHSGFSHTDKLWEVASKRNVNGAVSLESWKFKEDTPVNPPTHPTVNIGLKGAYSVRWDYDSTTNSYKRVNGGQPHMDSEHNVQISVKNVVVAFLNYSGLKQVTPGVFNRNVQTTGSGQAKIFRDGTVVEGSWKKDSRESRTRFFDATGAEIEFNRGQFWMEMIPVGTPV
jgi:hypothetical protein